MDEIESAKLLLEAQEHAEIQGRPILSSATIRFQQRRLFLLECLRLIVIYSANPDLDDNVRSVSRELIELILKTKDDSSRSGPVYIQKCLQAMYDIELWLQDLGDRVQGTIALGQTLSQESEDISLFQQQILAQQHESLSAIVSLLAKMSYSDVENFFKLLDHLSKIDRWNVTAAHYMPIILAFISQHGSPEGNESLREARRLHNRIMDGKDSLMWKMRHLQAATQTWWLAEYSGWYQEPQTGSPVEGADLEAEAINRSESFFAALKDGAFQCTLTVCSQITPYEWYDPARSSLIAYLLRDAPSLQQDTTQTSDWFRLLVMEQLESFVDAFISNMPDTLRRFKIEEDDQRKRIHSNLQPASRGSSSEQDLHLERFLVIISFAFDLRLQAAQSFWSDPDSNLYGFLQWASKRQSTPSVGAFCEMLRSISKGEECATSAHRFLLEEGGVGSARIRRYGSLSWSQIFGELSIYTARIREQPSASRSTNLYGGKSGSDNIDEPESVLMLESYLRLISHLCTESFEARSWILSQSNPHILDTLLTLCNNTVPSRLQACSFIMLRCLLTQKSPETAGLVWTALDSWASGAYVPPSIARPSKMASPMAWLEEVTLKSVASTFDQANEFTSLILALMSPTDIVDSSTDRLPFPENLGSAYRMPGVEPYIDVILDRVFATMSMELEEPLRNRVLTFNVLSLITVCLGTFNEDLLILAEKAPLPMDEAMSTPSLSTYVRLHPFCRTMEWLFNDGVLSALFAASHKDVTEVAAAPPDSPLVLSLLRSIEVMNLIMDLQSTYLNIARPLMTEQSLDRRQAVFNPSLASFEDSVALHLRLVVDLGLYSGLGSQDLAVSSLKLLGKLASSRRLNAQSVQGSKLGGHGNRLVSIMEHENDLERISRSLSLAMKLDPRELEQGAESPGWTIKSVILEFLVQTLIASPEQPTLAHALLGFDCRGTLLDVNPEGHFANGLSLFHATLQFVAEYPDGEEGCMHLWALSLRQMGMEVLAILWRSPLTSSIVLAELRASQLLFRLLIRQTGIDLNTIWDDRVIRQSDFLFTESAEALQQYFWQRNSLYAYASTEVRLITREGVPSLKDRISSALLGSTPTPEGELLSNLTVFDLLDFIELELPIPAESVEYNYFSGIDFSVSTSGLGDGTNLTYDMKLVEELLALRLNELRRAGRLHEPNEEERVLTEAKHIISFFRGVNNFSGLTLARARALAAWTDLMTLTVDICEVDADGRAALILQALQILTPKLEVYSLELEHGGQCIADLVRGLVFQFEFGSSATGNDRAGDFANDRLFQVFRAALRAISAPGSTMQLRETLYNICYHYLTQMTLFSDLPIRRRHGIQTVKTVGEKTVDIICDDAFGARSSCRIAALLLLDALSTLAEHDQSTYITDSLVRTNFLPIMIESIERVPLELRETPAIGQYEASRLRRDTNWMIMQIFLFYSPSTKPNCHYS